MRADLLRRTLNLIGFGQTNFFMQNPGMYLGIVLLCIEVIERCHSSVKEAVV